MDHNPVKQIIRSSLVTPALDLDFAGTKELDSRIQYSRGTGATFIGPTGNIEYAPENILLRSEQFNTIWTTSRTYVTANATTNPFGSLTAYKLSEDTSGGYHDLYQTVSSPNHLICFSVYAKAAEYKKIKLSIDDLSIGAYIVVFNLENEGSIFVDTNQGAWGSPTCKITPVSNGWYRCEISGQRVSGTSQKCSISLWSDRPNYEYDYYGGDGTSGVYIWGAQLERSSSARGYLLTTTSAAYGPRFTHDLATGKSLGLLVERASANKFSYSEFVNWSEGLPTGWTRNDTGVWSSDLGINGTYTAARINGSATNPAGALDFIFSSAVTPGVTNTVSAFFKRNTSASGTVCMAFDGTSSNAVIFSTANMPVGTWVRLSGSFVSGSGTWSSGRFHTNGTSINVTIDKVQFENNLSFATSYIPCDGGSVSRAADQVQITGTNFSSWYNPNQGTVILEATHGYILPPSVFLYPFQISNSTGTESFGAFNTNNSSQNTTYILGTTAAGGQYMQFSTNKLFGTGTYKTAVSYSAHSVFTSNDGSPVSSDTSVAIPSVDRLTIGGVTDFSSSAFFNGAIGRFTYFNKAISQQNTLSVLSS
jgi:hypothetical protein